MKSVLRMKSCFLMHSTVCGWWKKTPTTRTIIEVFNLLGKKVVSKKVLPDTTKDENTATINLNNYGLTDGLYLIQINNGSEVVSTKLIINK